MKMMITGASGFLGRYLMPYLSQRGDQVTAVNSRNCDLTDAKSLLQYKGERFDFIYHLAAWTQAGDFCDKRRGEQWIVNQQINTNILHWWHYEQPQAKLIALGTSVSYGRDVDLAEENYLQAEPYDRYMAYAYTKRALLVGLQSLSRQYGQRYLYLIPSTLYGEDYPLDGRQLHFIYDLMRKILAGHRDNAEVILWGDGYQRRELVYIEDFVTWMVALAEQQNNNIINLGAGTDYSIRDFAEVVCRGIGYESKMIKYDTTGFVGAKSKLLLCDKLNRLLPDRAMTSLEEGLGRTIRWYQCNEPAS